MYVLYFAQLLNYLIISAVMYLFSVLVFVVNHNCICDSCDVSKCHQINEDSDSDHQNDDHFKSTTPIMIILLTTNTITSIETTTTTTSFRAEFQITKKNRQH